MGDRYDELLANPREILYTLNSSIFVGDVNNCPDTADAVDNYLNSGDLTPADGSRSRFNISAHFRRATFESIRSSLLGLGHGHHYVIRGTRPSGSRYARNHFFVMANIQHQIVLVDAFTHELLRTPGQIGAYLQRGEFSGFEYTTEFEATAPRSGARRTRRTP